MSSNNDDSLSCAGLHLCAPYSPFFSFALAGLLQAAPPVVLQYQLLDTRAYDISRFTQGLAADAQSLYISSGRYGESRLERVDKTSRQVTARYDLSHRFFAEGVTLANDKLYLLSWKAKRAWRFDANSLEREQSFRFDRNGWGITFDGEHLITSDGSNELVWRDAQLLTPIKTQIVTEQGRPVTQLNELEFAQGFIWANSLAVHRNCSHRPGERRCACTSGS